MSPSGFVETTAPDFCPRLAGAPTPPLVGSSRTAWHILLAALFEQRSPRTFRLASEVQLTSEPLRVDFVFTRDGDGAAPDAPVTLRRLWDLLPAERLVEFKSLGRPYRARDLDRVFSYLHLRFFTDATGRLTTRRELAGVPSSRAARSHSTLTPKRSASPGRTWAAATSSSRGARSPCTSSSWRSRRTPTMTSRYTSSATARRKRAAPSGGWRSRSARRKSTWRSTRPKASTT